MRNKEALPQTSAILWMRPGRSRSKALALSPAGIVFTGVFLFGVFLATGRANAAEYYVAPTGSDSNPGTMASPFASVQKANNAAAAGDTIWMRAGTYYSTTQIDLSKSGTSDANRTKIWAYQNEVPILDCSKYVSTNKAADVPAILVTGSWMHLRGLEIANGPVGASGDHSIAMLRTKGSSNNTFELLNIHHGFGPGLFIDTGMGGNLILNCDSHDNYDKNGSQGDGQNGDGFGVHYQTTGPSTIVRGCRAWIDSDDGYDLISQEVPVIVENSFAIQNGYSDGGAGKPSSGNGNGFKMGSSKTGIRHIVRNNVSWKNRAAGFYANHSTGGNDWFNNTSYMNSTQYDMLASSFDSSGSVTGTVTLTGARAHKMRNNIGFPNKNSNMGGVDSMFNTWDLNISEAGTDFASTSDTGCTGPRQADGSVPAACEFLKLKAGSPLIDKGTDVMLPYVGAAPDLGAYEYGAVVTAGTGGATAGSGGGTGAGGATGSGGNTGSGASTGSGGIPGGAGGSGGNVTVATGGGTGTGGLIGTGGTFQGSGGDVAAGTGGSPIGSGSGGATGTGATGGSGPGVMTSSGGCGCAVGAGSTRNEVAALLLMVGALSLIARRRPNRR